MKTQSISIEELTGLLAKAWKRVVKAEHADIIALATIKTALQKDARLNPIADAVDDLQKALTKQSNFVEINKLNAICSYDFCGMPGIAFMPLLNEKVVALAKKHGVGLISIKNSSAVDTLSTWLLGIPEHDCIGIFIWNGGSYTTVPFGSREPFFGTNPIAYIIPTSDQSLLLDMSTSEIPFMNLMQALRERKPLPNGAGVNAQGIPTTDAAQVYDVDNDSEVTLLPMGGGYKGSGIMLLIEILTGALIGAAMAREATSNSDIPEEFGGILVAIDIAAFTSPAVFRKRVTTMLDQIHSSSPASGFSKVRMPGDASRAREMAARQTGVYCVEEATLLMLRQLAQ